MNNEVMHYQFNLIKNILATALPIAASTCIGTIALLINYQILSASNIHYLYWLALYAPFNYFLIALYEALKASSIFFASKTALKEMGPEQIRMMLSLFAIACVTVICSGVLFLIFGFHHEVMNFYYFCTAMIFSSLFVSWFYIITSFYYGLQYKNLSVYLSVIAATLHCMITYVLSIKYQWGIFSYVLSNFLSYGITGCLSFSYFIQDTHHFYITRVDLWHGLKLLLAVGFPVWASYFVIFISLLLTNHMLAYFGQNIISAYSLVYRMQSFMLLPAIAFGTALAILINQYRAKHQLLLAKDTFQAGMLLSVVLYTVIAVLCFTYKNFLMHWMTDQALIAYAGVEYFKYCSLSYSMLGPIIVYGVLLEQTGFGHRNLFIQSIYFSILIAFGWYATQILHSYHYFYFFIGADNLSIFLLICFMIIKLDFKKLRK